jgi:hypothetical protein
MRQRKRGLPCKGTSCLHASVFNESKQECERCSARSTLSSRKLANLLVGLQRTNALFEREYWRHSPEDWLHSEGTPGAWCPPGPASPRTENFWPSWAARHPSSLGVLRPLYTCDTPVFNAHWNGEWRHPDDGAKNDGDY